MYRPDHIAEELKTIAPGLIPALGIQVYEAPENYFDEFPLTFYPSKMLNPNPAMGVPEGYFTQFASSLMEKIRESEKTGSEAEELKEAPALFAVGKGMPFSIPDGYMDAFAGEVLREAQPAKVITMRTGRTSVFRYAAAAVVTGLLGLGIFNGMNQNAGQTESAEQQIILAEAKNILSTNSFEQTLESIAADDIVNYLENKGQDVDAAVVAVAATQNDLPEPEDYLFDEQALDNFLKDLNPGSQNIN